MAPLSKPEDDKWGAKSLLAVVHPSCLPGRETQGTEMNEEIFHVAARKKQVTKMAAPDLLSYRIHNYQIASPPLQHLSA